MNIVFESLEICLSDVHHPRVQNLAIAYVRKTSGYFLEKNINFAAALFGGGPYIEDVEPEIDHLIDISTLDAESRAGLAQILAQSLGLARQQLKSRSSDHGDDNGPGSFTWEEGSTWDAIRKLLRHLLAMRMELKNEKSVRNLLPTVYQDGGYKIESLLNYLGKNPSALEFRTSETILHLASSIVDLVRAESNHGHGYDEADAVKCEELIPAGKRCPLWFEKYIPQHDGWALALGDELECITPSEMTEWIQLFEFGQQGSSPKASKAFQKTSDIVRSKIGELSFTAMFDKIELSMHTDSPVSVYDETAYYPIRHGSTYSPSSVAILRGLIRVAGFYSSPRIFLSLERMMERCFEKIAGTGPRCESLGQEALDSMGSMEIEGKQDRIQQALVRFQSNKNVRKRLTKTLLKAGGTV